MNILVISNLFPPDAIGGYEILCSQVAAALAHRGHRVSVLTSEPPAATGSTHQALADANPSVRVRRELTLTAPFGGGVPRSRTWRRTVGRRNADVTRRVLEQDRPDVVFIWSQLRLTLGAAQASERAGLPVCYTMNDPHLAGYAPRKPTLSPRGLVGALLDRGPYRSDTARALALENVTCISDVVEEDLRRGGAPLPDPKIIHQGIPIERFPMKDDPGALRTPLRLLYAGQLLDYKGPDVLLRAAARLRGEGGRSVRVSMVGGGPMRAELEALASALSLEVDFVGAVEHGRMPQIYREHDVMAFTSTWREPFGLTHLEAMASGTPVVSTAVGGQAAFLRDGENALVVPPGDDARLAAALGTLIDSPPLARRLALGGRRTVEESFTLDRYVEDLERWLRNASLGRWN